MSVDTNGPILAARGRSLASGISLLEICAALFILAVIAGLFIPLASGLIATDAANSASEELRAIYAGIVGDSKANTFGYLGDVGEYPTNLLDLISPSPVPPGWNGPYITGGARIENAVLYDRFGGAVEYFRP